MTPDTLRGWQANDIIIDVEVPLHGCISSKRCDKCGCNMVCDSSGKAGTKEGDIIYILGPCCCMLRYCSNCNHDMRGF